MAAQQLFVFLSDRDVKITEYIIIIMKAVLLLVNFLVTVSHNKFRS